MAGLWDTLIEGGLSLYDKYKGRENMPVNERIFLESTLDKSKEKITEKNLTAKELKDIESVIYDQYAQYGSSILEYKKYIENILNKDAQEKSKDRRLYPEAKKQWQNDLQAIQDFENKKLTPNLVNFMTGERSYWTNEGILSATGRTTAIPKLKTSFTYDDYSKLEGQGGNRSLSSGNTSQGKVSTFLGQFNYGIDPKTKSIIVKDIYDFNPPKNIYTGQSSQPTGDVQAADGNSGSLPYNILRAYAGRTIPPGSGREVYINLNYQDPFGDTTK